MTERIQKAVALTLTAGYQLDKDGFEFLKTISKTMDPVKLIEKTVKHIENLSEKPLFINRNFLEGIMNEIFPEKEEKPPLSSSLSVEAKRIFHAYAKGVESDVKVVKDPTDKIDSTGSVEVYLEYFRDRFKRMRNLLRQRMDARDTMDISAALKASVNSKIKIIGMITEKRDYKQRLILRIEDLEACATVLVTSKSLEVFERAQSLLLDQVICVSAIKGKNNLLILEEFIWPDIPQRKPRKASLPIYAALISDLHVGSKMFMSKALNRFVLWLNGKFGNSKVRKMASNVKYVVIAGDLVDGIGVYPGQEEELQIMDIYEQYQAVSKFLERIPDYIEVIIIPGNHDVSRKALPQPALPKDYAEPLYETREVHSLGNPCVVQLHGVELFLCHGRSLDDIAATVPNIGFNTPEKAMKILLRSRHLTPIYGKRTPIAPEKRDFMVIERPPDIFHAGHVHISKYDKYRGTLIVNSGAWQEQTEYQKRMGLIPTPGIASIVNLQTLEVNPINFTEDS